MRRRLVLGALALVAVCGCTPGQIEWYAEASPEQREFAMIWLVRSDAEQAGVDPNLAEAIVRCESGFNPTARNVNVGPDALGLYQHLDVYWPGRAAAIGFDGAEWWDPIANSRVGAWMLATQGTDPWRACR